MAKGILVILMVVYHSLNYTSQYYLAFRYLSFLPPSFILITGFLISIVYYPRYCARDSNLWIRLLTRGMKLLLLFTILNVVAQYVRSPAYGQSQSIGAIRFFQQWHEVFVIGTAQAAVFEVLLPIAYLLLLAPALIWLAHRHFVALPSVTVALVASCGFLDAYGMSYPNLYLMNAGLVGMAAGRLLPKAEMIGRPFIAAVAAYVIYFPFSLIKGYVYLVQLIGASIALVLICSISVRLGEMGRVQNFLIRHGKYSLLAYIVQIGALQTLSRFIGRPEPVSLGALIMFLCTVVITIGASEATEWARRRFRIAEIMYKAVFA
jgi:hypothetical protein